MKPPEAFYDHHYGDIETDVHAEIRSEIYGVDLGQASWLSADEAGNWFDLLALHVSERALEVASGSGGMTCALAQRSGASCIGVDVNPHAVEAAKARAKRLDLSSQVTFCVVDAAKTLPFEDGCFDAILCNDSINHLPDRHAILCDWCRILRPGGRLLFTDPIVVTGQLSSEEIATRSSIGFFLWTPVGRNETLLEEAGFAVVGVRDLTQAVAAIASRWITARERRRERLVDLEGSDTFESFQRFLRAAFVLAAERRLSRFLYFAKKRGKGN